MDKKLLVSIFIVLLVIVPTIPNVVQPGEAALLTCVYVGGSAKRIKEYVGRDLSLVVHGQVGPSNEFGGVIKAMAADTTYLYAVGATNLTCKQYWQSNVTLRTWSSLANGGTNYAVCADGTYVYFGGASSKVYQCWASNLTKRSEIGVNMTVNQICCDSSYLYIATKYVMKYWRSNLTKVCVSRSYGANISAMVTDGNYLYVGGPTICRVYQLCCSDLSKKSQSQNFNAPIESMCLSPNGTYLYVGMLAFASGLCRLDVNTWSAIYANTGAQTHTYTLAVNASWVFAGCSNTSTNTVREYFTNNLTKHLQSSNYGGEIRGLVLGTGQIWLNTAPVICNPIPENRSIGIQCYPQLSVDVEDPDVNQTLQICFWENHTVPGSWTKIQQNTSMGFSKIVCSVMNATFVTQKNSVYWWKVTACDGSVNSSCIYCFKTEHHPPWSLRNDATYETSVMVHSGYNSTDQVVHSDILYFPNGWGNVNGSQYKYWLSVQGYYRSMDDYEQPCILVSNNISNNSWIEPANNYYHTNPISKYVYSGRGHYCDGDIVYNDITNQIWLYIINGTGVGVDPIEIYTTSNGVNWSLYARFRAFGPNQFLSISVIKDGSTWWCWGRNGSGTPHLECHTSTDGINWGAGVSCGSNMVALPEDEAWHINVNKYNGQFWGMFVESPIVKNGSYSGREGDPDGTFRSGERAKLYFINSTDGYNWTGYDKPILDWGPGDAWDNHNIYRSDFIVIDGVLKSIYTGANACTPAIWHAGYASNMTVGGTGHSSNVIII
jgi:hypothetical protein